MNNNIQGNHRKNADQLLSEIRSIEQVSHNVINSSWFLSGEKRLDASFYAQDVIVALRTLNDSHFEKKRLGEIPGNVFYPGRFKRVYADNLDDGTPFLTASQTQHFRPQSDKYLSKISESHDECLVEPNWLLITRSGSVGRIAIVDERLSGFVITDDLIRIALNDFPVGYLFTYLSSWIGQALITKDQYGSAIKHLEPHHLESIDIPIIDENTVDQINSIILESVNLRADANGLIDKSIELIHSECNLPDFSDQLIPYFSSNDDDHDVHIPHPKAFTQTIDNIKMRLDASFHIPIARTAISLVKSCKHEPVQLGRFIDRAYIPNRFKRVYVEKQFGVPFLQGSHLPQMRIYDLKYLSKRANQDEITNCELQEGFILLTRSGTIGRVEIVTRNKDGWTASEHLIRIITNDVGYPGFITAFLMTPYGQHQLDAKIYGAVVDELTPEDTEKIWIPNPPEKFQKEINDYVTSAFEKKDRAYELEKKAIGILEELFPRQH